MIVESALAVIALIAVGVVWTQTNVGGGDKFLLSAPPTIFAGGIANMYAGFGPGAVKVLRTLLTLTYSAFCFSTGVISSDT